MSIPLRGALRTKWLLILCDLLFFFHLLASVSGDAAILNISYIQDGQDGPPRRMFVFYCAAFNPDLTELPSRSDSSPNWVDLKSGGGDADFCDESYPLQNYSGKIVAAYRHNCSAYDQGMTAYRSRAAGLIIVTSRMFLPGTGHPNVTTTFPSSFPVLVLKKRNFEEMEELPFAESWKMSVYSVEDSYIVDGSGACLIVIAVIVITIGSFRSGQHRFSFTKEAQSRLQNAMEPQDKEVAATASEQQHSESEKPGVHFGPVAVVIFAMFMTGLLVLMYFFYDYLVYVFIALFAIGAISGVYECFRPILAWTDFGACRMSLGQGCLGKCCGTSVDLRSVFLLSIGLTLSVTWIMVRSKPYGWILLDVLGSFLLISVLIGIQLPSLKACTIFLCLLFIYDVFFVFITPHFTTDGQSVMIQVATGGYDPTRDSGGGQREVIPAAFKIPHIPTGSLCEDLFDDPSYSLLGFGDVMVPGFLISYLRSFELVTKIRPIYSVSACVAYFISLVVTTAALILMRTGQPALLYIVPILLVTVVVIGWRRRELLLLWNGNLGVLYVTFHGAGSENSLPGQAPVEVTRDTETDSLSTKGNGLALIP